MKILPIVITPSLDGHKVDLLLGSLNLLGRLYGEIFEL